uniref:Uncharacterized protein n=1 Tax=Entomoneis paludosa TaxID=265537 RepID=A0A7S2YAT7_9STRA|mmetsp:Transcript_24664/g.51300  ORF Transcript_24664/g.51300 Transcript_24664/m.51300 type:complete len:222 (+) Transcript_24664:222-887(+)
MEEKGNKMEQASRSLRPFVGAIEGIHVEIVPDNARSHKAVRPEKPLHRYSTSGTLDPPAIPAIEVSSTRRYSSFPTDRSTRPPEPEDFLTRHYSDSTLLMQSRWNSAPNVAVSDGEQRKIDAAPVLRRRKLGMNSPPRPKQQFLSSQQSLIEEKKEGNGELEPFLNAFDDLSLRVPSKMLGRIEGDDSKGSQIAPILKDEHSTRGRLQSWAPINDLLQSES